MSIENLLEEKKRASEYLKRNMVDDFTTKLDLSKGSYSNNWPCIYGFFRNIQRIKSQEELRRISEEISNIECCLSISLKDNGIGITILNNIVSGASYRLVLDFMNKIVRLAAELYKTIQVYNMTFDKELNSIVIDFMNLMGDVHGAAAKKRGPNRDMERQFLELQNRVNGVFLECQNRTIVVSDVRNLKLARKFKDILF